MDEATYWTSLEYRVAESSREWLIRVSGKAQQTWLCEEISLDVLAPRRVRGCAAGVSVEARKSRVRPDCAPGLSGGILPRRGRSPLTHTGSSPGPVEPAFLFADSKCRQASAPQFDLAP